MPSHTAAERKKNKLKRPVGHKAPLKGGKVPNKVTLKRGKVPNKVKLKRKSF